jgi:hypothetical protein
LPRKLIPRSLLARRGETDQAGNDLPERAVDVSALRANTGYITLDDGYGNTGSCVSNITFIDGDQGILRYRGIPIEEWRRNPRSSRRPI